MGGYQQSHSPTLMRRYSNSAEIIGHISTASHLICHILPWGFREPSRLHIEQHKLANLGRLLEYTFVRVLKDATVHTPELFLCSPVTVDSFAMMCCNSLAYHQLY